MKEREIEIQIAAEPVGNHKEVSEYFGKNVRLWVTFAVSEVEFLPAEPNAGFPCDSYEATDVDLINVWVEVLDLNGEVEYEKAFDIDSMPKGITDYLKMECLDVAMDHPDWAQELADADADRRYESMMEDRWEREHEDF